MPEIDLQCARPTCFDPALLLPSGTLNASGWFASGAGIRPTGRL